jgi:hypothetical protein
MRPIQPVMEHRKVLLSHEAQRDRTTAGGH